MGSTTTWQNARSANGPAVASFLDEWLARQGQSPGIYGDAFTRRLYEWRRGGNVCFYTLDRWLTVLGLMPHDLPDDLWRDRAAKDHRDQVPA